MAAGGAGPGIRLHPPRRGGYGGFKLPAVLPWRPGAGQVTGADWTFRLTIQQ